MIEAVLYALLFLLTLLTYIAARVIYKHFSFPITLPLVTSTAFIILLILFFDIDYGAYQRANDWVNHLLGAAVVSLALPLYKQLPMLKRFFAPIMLSVTIGTVLGVYSGIYLAKWLGVETTIISAIAPKSVTTPVAMEVAASIGGVSSLAAVFVMIAGISGAVCASYLFKICRITHPVGKGLGMGCASHAIGTAKAFETSEVEGAASSVAMTISAVLVAFFLTFIF